MSMSLHAFSVPGTTFFTSYSPPPCFSKIIASCAIASPSSLGSLFGAKAKLHFDVRPRSRCTSYSRLRIQEHSHAVQHDLSVIKWQEIVDDDEIEEEDGLQIKLTRNEIKEGVEIVKSILQNMGDGEISVSAYDTAWVALVEDDNDGGNARTPQFPSAVRWIADHQLSDGSWGDPHLFSYHDRLINTLACVVALRYWNVFPHQYHKGIAFFRENIEKIREEQDEQMPIGFEVAFPSLLETARGLNIDVPYGSPVLQDIYAKKNLKLTRIPKDIMHNIPTTLLHSLEGMPGLDWEKLLKLQCQDGSFLFSPSSTAFALMQTKDDNCLRYLRKVVQRFNGGVPNVYPVDLFERIWAVDRLQRLGISRYFEAEIRECVDYLYRHWSENGICWARYPGVQDIDDTAMGFRLLRLHGYDVSADVFKNFEKDGEFFCFAGQSNQAVTGMFNLYRASQVAFSGEQTLENAKEFSYRFLKRKQEANQLVDKWIITKDLPGEIGCALEIPWYASLPRVETRFYIEQYGGENDVWIGKTLYRMPYVNNNVYLELAKQDFNDCQALHRVEWDSIQKWYEESRLGECGMSRRSLLVCYFLAAANIFEPERSQERLAWAKTSALVEAISSCYGGTSDLRRGFADEFRNYTANARSYIKERRSDRTRTKQARLVGTLIGMLNHLSLDALMAHGRDIGHHLRQAWGEWVEKWKEEGKREGGEAELVVKMLCLSTGRRPETSHPLFNRLCLLTNRISRRLSLYTSQKVKENLGNNKRDKTTFERILRREEIESDMKQLLELALQRQTSSTDELNSDIGQTFLTVAKSFYYFALCDIGTIHSHIARVLFERID